MVRLLLLLIITLHAPITKMMGQRDTANTRRNIIEVYKCFSTSLNGVHPGPDTNYRYVRGGWAFDYVRLIGKRKIGLELSSHTWFFHYRKFGDLEILPVGTLYRTYSYYYAGAVHYPLIDGKKMRFFVSVGAMFRTGHEAFVAAHWLGGWPELILEGGKQRDLGLSAGTRFTWFPFWRFALSADLRYTRFIIRATHGNHHLPDYKGTPQNYLSFQVKLGFCF